MTKRPPITPAQIAEIGERLKTAFSIRQLAAEMDLDRQTVAKVARPVIKAMREAGTLGKCQCGRERFHPRGCERYLANRDARWGTPEQRERRAGIIAAILSGDTYTRISEQWGLASKGAMNYRRWLTPAQRAERKAKEHARSYRSAAQETLQAHRDPTYALIAAAVPRWLSGATRDDAISDLYLAVLEGSVAVNDVAREARRFASQAVDQWESRYGPRSLDEVAFDGGRETFADMIVDPATLEPLEHRLSA